MTKPATRLSCPFCCVLTDCGCIDSRGLSDGSRRRRYECRQCHKRFTTITTGGQETVSDRPPGRPVAVQPISTRKARPKTMDRLRRLLIESIYLDVRHRGQTSEATRTLGRQVRATKGPG